MLGPSEMLHAAATTAMPLRPAACLTTSFSLFGRHLTLRLLVLCCSYRDIRKMATSANPTPDACVRERVSDKNKIPSAMVTTG